MPSPVKILIAHSVASQLQERMTVPHAITPIQEQSDAEMRELLAGTDVLVSGLYKPEWKLTATRRPLLVHSTGAGVDGIAFGSLPPASTVCNVYGHERGVAERVFMHALALQQGLLGLDRNLRRGNWTPQRAYLPELRDKHLLILGFGHIGRELVRWGKFLDMRVTVLTRTAKAGRDANLGLEAFGPLSALHSQLPKADFVVIAIPSTTGTVDLINEVELKLMKSTAFIINVGRGPVINEDALYAALRDRRIGGAGLDVWYRYPAPGQDGLPAIRPFQELDNVIMTPHKPTIETMEFRWGEIAANIARRAAGHPLLNVVWQHAEQH
ncbi:MAG: hypothetical protein RLZZ129_1545 [Verrucomicrobiota bacterium]|jgi:phosphoglycerate dehydrogenase-like enzyme